MCVAYKTGHRLIKTDQSVTYKTGHREVLCVTYETDHRQALCVSFMKLIIDRHCVRHL